jgi:hypothetical protein
MDNHDPAALSLAQRAADAFSEKLPEDLSGHDIFVDACVAGPGLPYLLVQSGEEGQRSLRKAFGGFIEIADGNQRRRVTIAYRGLSPNMGVG